MEMSEPGMSVQTLIHRYENHTPEPNTPVRSRSSSASFSETEWDYNDIFSELESNVTTNTENANRIENETENDYRLYELYELHELGKSIDNPKAIATPIEKFNLRKTLEYIEWLHQQINTNFQANEHSLDILIIKKRQQITNRVIIITLILYYGHFIYPLLKMLR